VEGENKERKSVGRLDYYSKSSQGEKEGGKVPRYRRWMGGFPHSIIWKRKGRGGETYKCSEKIEGEFNKGARVPFFLTGGKRKKKKESEN